MTTVYEITNQHDELEQEMIIHNLLYFQIKKAINGIAQWLV